jgi:tRNA threonylcarbamoyladenosine biosynthesis protein TsaB
MTAEALGFALDVPVYGVGSLETLAQQAAQTLNLPEGSEVVATLDARRKEIYWARYWVKKTAGLLQMEEVQPPQVGAPVVLNEELSENDATFIIGEGAKMYQLVQPDLPDELRHPNAAVLGQIALARAAAGKTQPTTPLYLRRPDVNVKTPPAASN